TLHPGRVDRIADRHFAQLHEPTILDARLVDSDERARRDELEPRLTDRDRCPFTRSGDRPVPPTALTERFHVAGARQGVRRAGARRARLGVLMRTVAPQGAPGAVPDLPTVTDVQQAGDLEPLEAERGPHTGSPAIVGILHDAQVRILHREAAIPWSARRGVGRCTPDEQRTV